MIFVPPHFMEADHEPAAGIIENLSILPVVELVGNNWGQLVSDMC